LDIVQRPSCAGGSASTGSTIASKPVRASLPSKNSPIRRSIRCMAPRDSRYCGPLRLRPYSQAPRVVGSTSSACSARPRLRNSMSMAIAVPHAMTFIMGRTICSVVTCGAAASTWWPSVPRTAAASWTAVATSGCTGSQSSVVASSAIRNGRSVPPLPIASTAASEPA